MAVHLKQISEHFTVRKLSEKEPALSQLVSDVIQKPTNQIGSVYSANKKLLESVKCSEADLKKKKQYFEITRLQKNRYTFQEIQDLLGISADEIEEWLLEAISVDIISGKIDQAKEELVIGSQRLGVVDDEKWNNLGAKLQNIRQKFEQVKSALSH